MASNTPRSYSSNPNLAEANKRNISGLNINADAQTNNLPLETPTIISSPRMATTQTSVLARAKAFDARAHAGRGAKTFSPSSSPPPMSPFVKSIGARILIPQGATNVTVSGLSNARSTSSSQPNTPVVGTDSTDLPRLTESMQQPPEQVREDSPTRPYMSSGAVSAESLPATATSRKGSVAPTEGGSSEDDQTPRQSTTIESSDVAHVQTQISRADSSRQTDYSLKPRTYSPDLEGGKRGSGRAEPPRLPKLYFEGMGDTASALPSARSIKSPYLSPNTEIAKAGWDRRHDQSQKHRHGQSLTVPPSIHQGQVVESPPPDDLDASNRTFFWHSPNDTDETDSEDDDADVEDNPGGFPALPRRSDTSMTSASALGPGGPSDWEHFYGGDYETELVDDTDVYLTEREKERAAREKKERADAAAEARRRSDQDEAIAAEVSRRFDESQKEDEGSTSRLRAEPALPTIQEGIQEEPEEGGIRQTDVEYNPDVDALDGFARSPAPATPATFNERPLQTNVPNVPALPASAMATKKSEEAVVDKNEEVNSDKGAEKANDVEEEQQRPDSEVEPADVRPITISRTPPPPAIKMPDEETKVQESFQNDPMSPPIDDPNAGQITVSMVLPADFNPAAGISPGDSQSSQSRSKTTSPSQSPPRASGVVASKSPSPQAEELANPYEGLSSMAKASLNRFVRMLNEEDKAESDQDKFSVFLGFAQHETKLRATLYDMDDEDMSLPASKRASVRSSITKKLRGSQPSLRSKPLPEAPDSTPPVPAFDPTLGRNQSFSISAASQAASMPPPNPPPDRPPPAAPGIGADKSGKLSDDFVMVDDPAKKSAATETPAGEPEKKTSLETLNKTIDLVAPRTSMISTPSVAADSQTSSDQGADSTRQSTTSSPLPGAQILNHSMSSKLSGSKPYDGDKATNRQSIYRPFSGMLRSSSSQRRASMESIRGLRPADKPERKGTAPVGGDLSVNVTDAQNAETSRPPRSPTTKTGALEALVAVVPQSNVLREESQQLARLRFDMDNIVDDFSFIHKTVLAWDSGAKVKRERYEHERQVRMSINERRVEDLFNDNEIGYADISQLEAEFKQNESVKKSEEEREEVESFVASVFDIVWARINYEMDQLTPLYREATELVADASAGRQMFEDSEERVPIAPIMELLLILYQKLMIRHQKAFEAVLERDRRLKKTEVSPWFAIGQIDKVKRIEKRFEDAEKKAILEFCRQRDERANLLMDVLDQHTLRGVGANQDYMESVMQAVRKIAVQVAKADGGLDSPPSADDVMKTKFITIALSRSSEQIVRTFHIADMLLNAADYEVSVANAKLSNADAAAFRRLREAKSKEDAKLAADLDHRLGLIQGDTARTQEEIAKLMMLLDQEDPDLKFDLTRERDKRMVAKLTEKKSRGQSLQPPPA